MADEKSKFVAQNRETIGLLTHSYNNFLAGMMGNMELALLHNSNPEVEDFLQRSISSGNDAVVFGKTLLAWVGRQQLVSKSEPLENLIAAVQLKLSKIEISINYSKELAEDVSIDTDFYWFCDCLSSLIDFVAKAGNLDKIEVSLEKQQATSSIILTINNGSLVLTEEQQTDLFKPFYSSRVMLQEKDLGLAKAIGFCEQSKFSLKWDNNAGFVLEFSCS